MSLLILLQSIWPADKLNRLNRLYCKIQLLLTGTRVEYVISDKIDSCKNYLFCQNHVNLLDHVTMYNSTTHFKQGIELTEHFKIPFYGWFMKQRGTIGIERHKSNLENLSKKIEQEIARNHSILFFPEGGRTLDGHLKPFKSGIFKVADNLNIEIVPVVVSGMYKVLKKGSWHMTPGQKVTVTCLDPVLLSENSQVSLDEKINCIRQMMQETLILNEKKHLYASHTI
jgi:1-acyl-sn-glycerol-3-phosphate acyltransferase